MLEQVSKQLSAGRQRLLQEGFGKKEHLFTCVRTYDAVHVYPLFGGKVSSSAFVSAQLSRR